MPESVPSLFPVKGIPGPLLRPLPVLFGFGRLNLSSPEMVRPRARGLFTAHLRAFKAMLVAATRSTGLVPEAVRPVLLRCNALARCRGVELWENLEAFQAELLALHREHGRRIRDGAESAQENLRHLFRVETGPCGLAAVYSEQTWSVAAKLENTLTEGCWYDCLGCHEQEGQLLGKSADVAVFVPGDRPIRPDLERSLVQDGVPILVLAGMGRRPGSSNVAALRTVHHYRQRGYPVLQGQPTRLRLFQAIDGHFLRHLAATPQEQPTCPVAVC